MGLFDAISGIFSSAVGAVTDFAGGAFVAVDERLRGGRASPGAAASASRGLGLSVGNLFSDIGTSFITNRLVGTPIQERPRLGGRGPAAGVCDPALLGPGACPTGSAAHRRAPARDRIGHPDGQVAGGMRPTTTSVDFPGVEGLGFAGERGIEELAQQGLDFLFRGLSGSVPRDRPVRGEVMAHEAASALPGGALIPGAGPIFPQVSVRGIRIAGSAPGLFHTTPAGFRRPNRVTLVADPVSGNMAFMVDAGTPKTWSKVTIKSPHRHHHHHHRKR